MGRGQVVSHEAARRSVAGWQRAGARQGVAVSRSGAGRVDDREGRHDSTQDGEPGHLCRRHLRNLFRQHQGLQEPVMRTSRILFSLAIAVAIVVVTSAAGPADWPMWGGTPSRNMVSDMKGLPTTWDVKTGKNVKWV